ncbi:MAG: hypothetical protein ACR2PZ_01560 [Pseudomonadales bacterium]
MMFLILKIFLYLCVALAMGGAAGWLLRHINAQKELEELQRRLADSKTKVPKLESLLRAKEERIRALSAAQSERDEAMKGTRVQDEQAARALREKDMEVARLKNRIEVLERAEGHEPLVDAEALVSSEPEADAQVTDSDSDNTLIAQLHVEIERLKEEVASTKIQLEVARSDQGMEKEVAELTSRLRQKAEDYDRLQKTLQQEQRKVVELERERELQNRSLKVLHQQLEVVRDTGT